jgi:hypothetical protein
MLANVSGMDTWISTCLPAESRHPADILSLRPSTLTGPWTRRQSWPFRHLGRRGIRVTDLSPPLPRDARESIVCECLSEEQGGLTFRARLSFSDETNIPSCPGSFEYRWTVSREELRAVEQQTGIDQLLLDRRRKEEERFLEIIADTLKRTRTRLVLVGTRFLREYDRWADLDR